MPCGLLRQGVLGQSPTQRSSSSSSSAGSWADMLQCAQPACKQCAQACAASRGCVPVECCDCVPHGLSSTPICSRPCVSRARLAHRPTGRAGDSEAWQPANMLQLRANTAQAPAGASFPDTRHQRWDSALARSSRPWSSSKVFSAASVAQSCMLRRAGQGCATV